MSDTKNIYVAVMTKFAALESILDTAKQYAYREGYQKDLTEDIVFRDLLDSSRNIYNDIIDLINGDLYV